MHRNERVVADFDAAMSVNDRVVTDEDIVPKGDPTSERPKHHAVHKLAVIADRNTSLTPKISVGGKADASLKATADANRRAATPSSPDSESRAHCTKQARQEVEIAIHRIFQD